MKNTIINLNEEFPHLTNAPIVEAVIDIRITPKGSMDEGTVSAFLKQRLPDYPTQKNMNSKSLKIDMGSKIQSPIITNLGFVGSRVDSTSEPYVAQFNNEAFVFSRLVPYNEWDLFMPEALRLWELYCELNNPEEIQRIGVRFINKIDALESPIELSDYYENAPDSIKNTSWPIVNYTHKDTYQPTHPYIVNVIRTVNRGEKKAGAGLILDVDVIMNQKFSNDLDRIKKHLMEMKYLKNKAFFGGIKPSIIERYR